jgi:hypothetical protein
LLTCSTQRAHLNLGARLVVQLIHRLGQRHSMQVADLAPPQERERGW